MAINKLIRNGEVAIIYSPGYGAGWYSWNRHYYGHELLFDKKLAELVLLKEEVRSGDARRFNKTLTQIEEYVSDKFPDAYNGGLGNAIVRWIPKGTAFEIREYDGAESIEFVEKADIIIA